jgi:hypothetical protein
MGGVRVRPDSHLRGGRTAGKRWRRRRRRGFKGVWMAAQTMGAAQTSACQALGAWTVPSQ